jgi:hypothetical protein
MPCRQDGANGHAHHPREGLGSRIQARFARLGGVELELPDRADRPCDQPFA